MPRTIEDVYVIVKNEGFSFAMRYYGKELESKSKELNDAWVDAFDAFTKIDELLMKVKKS